MPHRIHPPRPLLLAVVLGFGMAVTAGSAGGTDDGSPWQSWSRLRLKAKGAALFSGRVEMTLGGEPTRRVFETHTVARFLGARVATAETTTVLDTDGKPLTYVSRNKKRARRFRFAADRYSVERLKPVHGPEAPLDRWEVTSRREFPYPTDDTGRPLRVFDYYGMLLQLRRMPLNRPGDEATIHVATSKGPTAFTIRVDEARTSDWSYKNPALGARRRLPVQELRLRIVPADPERADEGFLKMEGETELWVEAHSKTLLSLGGKIPKVPGRVRLVLVELE